MPRPALHIARACLQAYVDKDRDAIESLLAADFRFTSPLDNTLDRETYFTRCWPSSQSMEAVDFMEEADLGNRAFLVYEARTLGGKRFRNVEMYTARAGKLKSVEVYFGWDLPHPAPAGGFVEDEGTR